VERLFAVPAEGGAGFPLNIIDESFLSVPLGE
jgi:hypothetical protein